MSESSAFTKKKKNISAFKIYAEHSAEELEMLKDIQKPDNISGPEGDSSLESS